MPQKKKSRITRQPRPKKSAGGTPPAVGRDSGKKFAAEDLVMLFKLEPHPEGGYFRQTYKLSESIPQRCLPAHYRGNRAYSTVFTTC